MSGENQRHQCKYQLIGYAPHSLREEFIQIGALIWQENSDGPGNKQMELRFTRDWRRVRCFDPDADVALLESIESELRHGLNNDPDGKLKRIIDEALSNNLRMSTPKAYEAESLPAGIEELMRMYVDPPKREGSSRLSGRAAIHNKMRAEFEHVGVWDLMRKRIPVSDYTRPGDTLRIDAGYRPNGVIRMFHAVSLEPDLDLAKVLAFSAAGLRSGVERMEQANLQLTAIVEPISKIAGEDRDAERLAMYRFGVETMEEAQIRVLTTADLNRVAETARLELRV
ncbi:MAG: DUF3037 domain-containing protein [Acidobacteria bacterium]|nr:DUF3037 domain-containing protein [Acidobacteriota bacterium]